MGIVLKLFTSTANPLAIFDFCVFGFLGGILASIAPGLIKGIFGKKKKKDGDSGGGSWLTDLLGGLAGDIGQSIAAEKGTKQELARRKKWLEQIKPKGKYSRGVDPVVQRSIEQTFASRGMENPYESIADGETKPTPTRNRPVRRGRF